MIFEKAWAKLHGSYESIEGGETEDALQYLTGARFKLHCFVCKYQSCMDQAGWLHWKSWTTMRKH